MTYAELSSILESLVDEKTLLDVVYTLDQICQKRATNLRQSPGQTFHDQARLWDKAQKSLARAEKHIFCI